MNKHRGSDFNEFLIEEGIMTPTPRTDAIAHRGLGSVAYIAEMTSFARQLEQELGSPTDSPDANTTAHARVNWWKQRCDELNEQLAAGVRGAELIARMLSDERALADRLAGELQWWVDEYNTADDREVLAAWKEARK